MRARAHRGLTSRYTSRAQPLQHQRVAITRDTSFVQDTRRCARKLGAVAQACRGPRGRHQLLRADESDGSGAVLLTTVSARLFSSFASRPSRPSIQLLVDAVSRHHAIHGDAGLLIMQMATRYSTFLLAFVMLVV